ncbi:pyrokinin-1 receptor isoform X2 [Aethina tumida]|uniref:pyrokinin-1 receptor isoform X2 n=1 Tax=Aethina tumida TaxID=116153 RepID=UPI002148B11F|nr:pyrokinin-1 receptor isoform X2 [Aethina tumida]
MKNIYPDHIRQNHEVTNAIYQFDINETALNISFHYATNGNVAYNESDWGPKRDPLYIVIPISLIYVLTFVSGVLGNISTCIVIARNKSMHTATNYYLFSLAISDLLLLISGLPPEIYAIWSKYPYIFGEAFCVLQGFAAETSANATVLTITAFTMERYVAICHPFLSHTLSKLNRAIKFIIAIWILAMCLAVPLAMAFGVVCAQLADGNFSDEQCICTVKRVVMPHAFEISTFVFFIAPMSLITVLYILIGLQLHRSTVGPSRGNSVKLKHRVYKPVTSCSNPMAQAAVALNGDGEKLQSKVQEEEGRKNFAKNAQATKHVVKMLIAVVVAFFICWAPFHAQRLLAIYGQHTSAQMIRAFQILTYISGVFYYLSTTVNPLLYHIMSHKFREAFKNTYKNCGRKGHRFPGATRARYGTSMLKWHVCTTLDGHWLFPSEGRSLKFRRGVQSRL